MHIPPVEVKLVATDATELGPTTALPIRSLVMRG